MSFFQFFTVPESTVSDEILEVIETTFSKLLTKDVWTNLIEKCSQIKGTDDILVAPIMDECKRKYSCALESLTQSATIKNSWKLLCTSAFTHHSASHVNGRALNHYLKNLIKLTWDIQVSQMVTGYQIPQTCVPHQWRQKAKKKEEFRRANQDDRDSHRQTTSEWSCEGVRTSKKSVHVDTIC